MAVSNEGKNQHHFFGIVTENGKVKNRIGQLMCYGYMKNQCRTKTFMHNLCNVRNKHKFHSTKWFYESFFASSSSQ